MLQTLRKNDFRQVFTVGERAFRNGFNRFGHDVFVYFLSSGIAYQNFHIL